VTDLNASSKPTHELVMSVLADLRSAAFSRRGLIVLAALSLALGLAFNWSWFVAIGAAPIILAVLPCAVMCAFGLCMAHGNHQADGAASTGPNNAGASAKAETDRSCCAQPRARSK
jgi:hypothetical protein